MQSTLNSGTGDLKHWSMILFVQMFNMKDYKSKTITYAVKMPWLMPLICHNLCRYYAIICAIWWTEFFLLRLHIAMFSPTWSGEPCLVWISLVQVSESLLLRNPWATSQSARNDYLVRISLLLLAYNAQFIHVQNSIYFEPIKIINLEMK